MTFKHKYDTIVLMDLIIKTDQLQPVTDGENLQNLFIASGFENFGLVSESGEGYVFQDLAKIDPDADVVLFDLDDTMIPYTEAKNERLSLFQEYVLSQGLDLDSVECGVLMDCADDFSRWGDSNGDKKYHQQAHSSALAWVVDELKSGKEFNEITSLLESFDVSGETDNEPPFSLKEAPEDMSEVFDAMTKINPFDDVIETVRRLASTDNLETPFSVGILTYGEPDFQLKKVLHVLQLARESGHELPFNQIMFTKVKKGKFLKAIIEKEKNLKAYVLVDDSPEELDSRDVVRSRFARLAPIRIRKAKTKNYNHDWGMKGHEAYKNNSTGIYDEQEGADLFEEVVRVAVNIRSKLAEGVRGTGREAISGHNKRVRSYGKELLKNGGHVTGFSQTLINDEAPIEDKQVA